MTEEEKTIRPGMRLIFTVEYPPSLNAYWRFPKQFGRPILSREAREYKIRVGYGALAAGIRPQDGPLAVTLWVFRPARRGDLDNSAKVLLDALNKVAWGDDKQIVELHLYRRDDKERPRVEVEVDQRTEEQDGTVKTDDGKGTVRPIGARAGENDGGNATAGAPLHVGG